MKNKVDQKVMMAVVYLDQQMGASHAGPWLIFLAFSHRFSFFPSFLIKKQNKRKNMKKEQNLCFKGVYQI